VKDDRRREWTRLWTALAVAATLAAGLVAGCDGEPPRPVGLLSVTPAEVVLAWPETSTLTARWEATAPLADGTDGSAGSEGARVFVHLLDEAGSVARTFDHALPFDWHAAEAHGSSIELWQSALAEPLPPGDYRLTVGLYDPGDGHRWPLETDAPAVDDGEYAVATVVVPPASPGPGLAFEGSWWPAEPGADRQVLARRWLKESGRVVVSDLRGPARLGFALRIPEPGAGGRLVLREGATRPVVAVSSSCATGPVSVEGPGEHRVALELHPGEDGRCVVDLAASFAVVDLETLRSRSAGLERLTVDPLRYTRSP